MPTLVLLSTISRKTFDRQDYDDGRRKRRKVQPGNASTQPAGRRPRAVHGHLQCRCRFDFREPLWRAASSHRGQHRGHGSGRDHCVDAAVRERVTGTDGRARRQSGVHIHAVRDRNCGRSTHH